MFYFYFICMLIFPGHSLAAPCCLYCWCRAGQTGGHETRADSRMFNKCVTFLCVCVCVCVKDWASCVGEQAARIAVEASLPHTTAMCAPLDRLSTPQSPFYFSPLLTLLPSYSLQQCQLALSVCSSHTRLELIFMLWLYFRKGWRWAWIEAVCLAGIGVGVAVVAVCEARGGASCCRGRVQCLFFPRELHQQQQWSVANTLEKKYILNCAFMLF